MGGMDSASMMRGGQPYPGHYGGMMPSKRGRKPLNLTNPNLHGNLMDNCDQGSASQSGINEGSQYDANQYSGNIPYDKSGKRYRRTANEIERRF